MNEHVQKFLNKKYNILLCDVLVKFTNSFCAECLSEIIAYLKFKLIRKTILIIKI